MYNPRSSGEPNGCIQSVIITRVIFSLLLVPIGLICVAIFAILMTFWALSISPFLALLVIVVAGGLLLAAGKWEARRIASDTSSDEP